MTKELAFESSVRWPRAQRRGQRLTYAVPSPKHKPKFGHLHGPRRQKDECTAAGMGEENCEPDALFSNAKGIGRKEGGREGPTIFSKPLPLSVLRSLHHTGMTSS